MAEEINEDNMIREATDSDRHDIGHILHSVDPLYSSIMPGSFSRYADKIIAHGLPTKYDSYVLENYSEVIGFIGTKDLDNSIGYVLALYIHHDQHGKGYGKQALDFIEDMFKSKQMNEIIIQVHEKAHWAINFYMKYGYRLEDKPLSIEHYKKNILKNYQISHTLLLSKRDMNSSRSNKWHQG